MLFFIKLILTGFLVIRGDGCRQPSLLRRQALQTRGSTDLTATNPALL
jgi:hypothetical protein